jgi:hypothetical protein
VNSFRYEWVSPKDKDQLLSDLESGIPDQIASALYAASRYESDWEWVQSPMPQVH